MKKLIYSTGREKRKSRIRGKIRGTSEKPRVSVFRSNKYIYAQIIDDSTGCVLVDVSSEVKKLHKGKTKTDAAFETGKELAKKALIKKVTSVVFDRSGYMYHGRVKSLADGARVGGLVF